MAEFTQTIIISLFILIRVEDTLEPILAALWALDRSPVHHRAIKLTPLESLCNFITCFWIGGGNQSSRRKPTQTWREHANMLHRERNQGIESCSIANRALPLADVYWQIWPLFLAQLVDFFNLLLSDIDPTFKHSLQILSRVEVRP